MRNLKNKSSWVSQECHCSCCNFIAWIFLWDKSMNKHFIILHKSKLNTCFAAQLLRVTHTKKTVCAIFKNCVISFLGVLLFMSWFYSLWFFERNRISITLNRQIIIARRSLGQKMLLGPQHAVFYVLPHNSGKLHA